MRNRYTPFGYCVKNGVITIQAEESEIVQRIFSEYIGGQSLKKIAEDLTAEKIEYLPQKWTWNKNRIVRMINDVRYMGTDQYSPIISEAKFQQAQSIKESRNTQTDYDRDQVISTGTTEMLCGNCGCPVKRIRDHRSKFGQKYVCTNKSCKSEYVISDTRIMEMISGMIMTSTPVVIKSSDAECLMEIHRMEQEIQRAMESFHADAEKIRSMILLCADKKYQLVSNNRADYDKLMQELSSDNFIINRKTVTKLIKQIKLLSNDEIELTLITGQTIRKE